MQGREGLGETVLESFWSGVLQAVGLGECGVLVTCAYALRGYPWAASQGLGRVCRIGFHGLLRLCVGILLALTHLNTDADFPIASDTHSHPFLH